jgi:hypothetical protein
VNAGAVRRGRWPLVAAALVLGVAAATTSSRLHASRSADRMGQELMYFPSGQLLRPAAVGHPLTLADLLWLRAIQYYGEHRLSDNRFPFAGHIFETITTLDPHFAEAYIFGGLVLAGEGRELERGIDLLLRGMAWNPRRWDLAFETGFVYYIAAKDDAQAARFFKLARQLPGAPEIVTRFAAHVESRAGDDDAALALWEELLRTTTHPAMRALAERKVEALRRQRAPGAPREQGEPGGQRRQEPPDHSRPPTGRTQKAAVRASM